MNRNRKKLIKTPDDYVSLGEELLNDISRIPTDYDYYDLIHSINKTALAFFEKAIDLNPNYTVAYLFHGITNRAIGNIDGALEDFNNVISLEPSNEIGYYERGLTFQQLGVNWRLLVRNQDAISDFKKAIDINPGVAHYYFMVGLSYTRIGEHEDAITYFDEAINLDPNIPDYYFYRGKEYRLLEQFDKGDKDIEKAHSLGFKEPRTRVEYFMSGGEDPEVVREIKEKIEKYRNLTLEKIPRKARTTNPGLWVVYVVLGVIGAGVPIIPFGLWLQLNLKGVFQFAVLIGVAGGLIGGLMKRNAIMAFVGGFALSIFMCFVLRIAT